MFRVSGIAGMWRNLGASRLFGFVRYPAPGFFIHLLFITNPTEDPLTYLGFSRHVEISMIFIRSRLVSAPLNISPRPSIQGV